MNVFCDPNEAYIYEFPMFEVTVIQPEFQNFTETFNEFTPMVTFETLEHTASKVQLIALPDVHPIVPLTKTPEEN